MHDERMSPLRQITAQSHGVAGGAAEVVGGGAPEGGIPASGSARLRSRKTPIVDQPRLSTNRIAVGSLVAGAPYMLLYKRVHFVGGVVVGN